MDRNKESQHKLTVKLSALQHFSYCPRQCALIYLEDIYQENIYTLQGNDVHEKVHQEVSRKRSDMRTETALPVWSSQLGLRGRADLVEFHLTDSSKGPTYQKIIPIEYKRGTKEEKRADEIQLCGQVLCLEEMFGETITEAYIYHHSSHARREVPLNQKLRKSTRQTIVDVRKMLSKKSMPEPVNDSRCDNCSLSRSCMPGCTDSQVGLKNYVNKLYEPSDE